MKRIFIFSILVVFTTFCFADNPTPYNPNADAKADLQKAIQLAKSQNKHVLVQVGGNWCPWCIRFHNMATGAYTLDSLIKSDYVYILVNYSKENKNMDVMKQLEYPNRFGFPVFVILDGNGKRLHTQDSGLLEHNKVKGYDTTKVVTFLREWDVKAVDPKTYQGK